ncbi:motility associated factor glycosyltransferase family protein [Helicobacter baculiformis]|uniref:Motility associated factor glycosyltransferase family protein n=1 Tax=Helicobacter baculiformis TaxID=427351 RepID=A0A1M4NGS3_9HELI|nr:motility associated factor glycosyltransferase family protein [Helicobacter baculiformis]SFZ71407.1 OMP739 [Helicobacter baculiformis]
MSNIYEKNLGILQRKDPLLALELSKLKSNLKYEVFVQQDAFNLVDVSTNTPLFAHKPLEENLARFEELKTYAYIPYLYFYGAGNGMLMRLFLGLEQLKRLVVIEPELEIIFIVLNLLDFSEEMQSDRLILLHSSACNYPLIASLFLMDKHAKIYAKVYELIIAHPYYERYESDFTQINQHFIKALENAVIGVGNDAKDAIVGIKHHVQNLPFVVQTPTLIHLVEVLKARNAHYNTAIIVSTGPSLNKQLPLLKEIAPYATLFCIDASFPILHAHGIKPDLVFSLERVEASAKFYQDTPKEAQEGVIFALTSIVHPTLRQAISKGTTQFSLRPFGYTSLFNLHQYGYLGIGMSAANMAYELVVHARFKRCVFIGQDLSFAPSGESHAHGAVYGAQEIKPKQEGEKIFIEAYGGQGQVESTRVWKLFLDFFEKDIYHTPYNLEVINATQGGARIRGTLELPFKEAVARIKADLVSTQEKPPLKLTLPSPEQSAQWLEGARETCLEAIAYAQECKEKIEALFLEVMAFLEEIEALNAKQELEKLDLKRIEDLSQKIDDLKGLFEEVKFNQCFNDAIQSYIFHQELDIAKIVVKPTFTQEDVQAKQLEWIYAHKYWLFSLAGGITCVKEVLEEALQTWE